MGTRLDMVFHGVGEKEGHRGAEALYQEMNRLERMMSRFRKDSPVWMINQLAAQKSIIIEDELLGMLLVCKEYHERTGGLFDISLGSVTDLINQGEFDTLAFTKALESSGMDQVDLDPVEKTIHFHNDLVKIDFGGFGKGYALERARKLLLSHEILNAFISFGESSVLALGNHPHGAGWKAGVNHQMITGRHVFSFELKDESLSTSGFASGRREGQLAEHILHPLRGITVKKYHHISIKSSSATTAEMLSTALIAGDERDRERILSAFPSCEAVGVIYDGNGKASIDMLTN
jgi:thiamine biosynthesis lipoprotein